MIYYTIIIIIIWFAKILILETSNRSGCRPFKYLLVSVHWGYTGATPPTRTPWCGSTSQINLNLLGSSSHFYRQNSLIYLVGGFNHLEKYESQWEGLSHILWKNKKCSKPTTSIQYIYLKPQVGTHTCSHQTLIFSPWQIIFFPWEKQGNTDLHNRVFLTSMCQNASRFVIFSMTNFYIRRRKVSRAFFSISHVVVMSHLDMLWR